MSDDGKQYVWSNQDRLVTGSAPQLVQQGEGMKIGDAEQWLVQQGERRRPHLEEIVLFVI